jgi:hypothetical protein
VSIIPGDTRAWYEAIYEGMTTEHCIEQRYIDPAGRNDDDLLSKPTFHSTIESAAAAALPRTRRYNTYCGMAWHKPGKRGRAEDCTATRCLWLDADAKHWGGDLAVVRRRLETFGLRLSILVNTWGGFHAAVLLDPLIDLTLPGMPERIEAANKHLAAAVGDAVRLDAVHDIARILRAPGTHNLKPEYGEPRPVTLVRLDKTCVYALEEVEA